MVYSAEAYLNRLSKEQLEFLSAQHKNDSAEMLTLIQDALKRKDLHSSSRPEA